MLRILNAAVLLTLAIHIEGKIYFRVVAGRDSRSGEFPYVLAIYIERPPFKKKGETESVFIRFCTGSLITPTWVLTAAHCFSDYKFPVEYMRVRYGDMSIPSQKAKEFFKKVLKTVPHPAYYPNSLNVSTAESVSINPNDIGLLQTEEISVKPLGRLSAFEYKSLIGLPVTYAGYGYTQFNIKDIELEDLITSRILQIGEGGTIPCQTFDSFTIPGICVASKCNKLGEYIHQGDSGGPLFYKDHIIGVASMTFFNKKLKRSIRSVFVPVSPYLEWINGIIH